MKLRLLLALASFALSYASSEDSFQINSTTQNGSAHVTVASNRDIAIFDENSIYISMDGNILEFHLKGDAVNIRFNQEHAEGLTQDLASGSSRFKSLAPEPWLTRSIRLAMALPTGEETYRNLKYRALAVLGVLAPEGQTQGLPYASGNPVNYAAYGACCWGCAAGGGGWLKCGNYCGPMFLNISF